MPDDSSKAAMQAFGVIPNAYFDLIARVMPGFLLLFGSAVKATKALLVEPPISLFRESSEDHR